MGANFILNEIGIIILDVRLKNISNFRKEEADICIIVVQKNHLVPQWSHLI